MHGLSVSLSAFLWMSDTSSFRQTRTFKKCGDFLTAFKRWCEKQVRKPTLVIACFVIIAHVCLNVCTPSASAFRTGCLAVRVFLLDFRVIIRVSPLPVLSVFFS